MRECPEGGFEIRNIRSGRYLTYPHVKNLFANSPMSFRVASANPHGHMIEIREKSIHGRLLGTCRGSPTGSWTSYSTVSCHLKNAAGEAEIYLVFRGDGGELLRLNWLQRFQSCYAFIGFVKVAAPCWSHRL
jgi:hypothetical protein